MTGTTVIHTRISNELDEFLEIQAQRPEFHNKAHVVTFALEELKEKLQ